MKKYLLTVMAVAGLASCSNETDSFNTEDPNEIRVAGQTIDASTKAPMDSKTANFRAMVLTSSKSGDYSTLYAPTAGKYMDFEKQFESVSTPNKVGFVDADGADSKQYYPTSTATQQEVYISGLMPAAASTSDESSKSDIWKYDAGNLTITFDGNDDVMIAKEASAEKGSDATLAFNHLLTQLVVKVQASVGDPEVWGNITKIVLKNVGGKTGKIYNQFAITGTELKSGTATVSTTAEAASEAVKFYNASASGSATSFTDTEYSGTNNSVLKSSQSTATTVAYMLCQAFDVKQTPGDTDLVLDVYTTRNSSTPKTVEIDLTSASDLNTAGYAFEITLDFQTNEIMASAEIADWKEGGNGTGVID